MISISDINLYTVTDSANTQENTDILLRSMLSGLKSEFWIERIVSNGYSSPDNFWYDQDFNEWCLLVEGNADLLLETQEIISLTKGDSYLFPAHCKHRVDKVSVDAIWLTVCWK